MHSTNKHSIRSPRRVRFALLWFIAGNITMCLGLIAVGLTAGVIPA